MPARWACASLTELPAVPGGLRQPCSVTRGWRFCPQLARGQAEPTAEGRAPKQTSISLCPPGQVSQTVSVGTSQPRRLPGPIGVFCSGEERKRGAPTPMWCWGCSSDGTNQTPLRSCSCPHPKPREDTAKGRAGNVSHQHSAPCSPFSPLLNVRSGNQCLFGEKHCSQP